MRDTATVGFGLGAGCTPDEAARFAIYSQNYLAATPLCPVHRLELSDMFEDWRNLVYVARIEARMRSIVAASEAAPASDERLLSGRAAA